MKLKVFTTMGVIALAFTLGGCAATAETEQPTTISNVWSQIGCKENDQLGTRGIIDLPNPTPPVVHVGQCSPASDGELAFFWEFESAQAASDWLKSGALELSTNDDVFLYGSVVILVSDNLTKNMIADVLEIQPISN